MLWQTDALVMEVACGGQAWLWQAEAGASTSSSLHIFLIIQAPALCGLCSAYSFDFSCFFTFDSPVLWFLGPYTPRFLPRSVWKKRTRIGPPPPPCLAQLPNLLFSQKPSFRPGCRGGARKRLQLPILSVSRRQTLISCVHVA